MQLGRVHPYTASKAPPGTHTASHTRLRVHRDQGHWGLPLMNWELGGMLPLWDDAGLFMLHVFLDYSDPGPSVPPHHTRWVRGLGGTGCCRCHLGSVQGSCKLPPSPGPFPSHSLPPICCFLLCVPLKQSRCLKRSPSRLRLRQLCPWAELCPGPSSLSGRRNQAWPRTCPSSLTSISRRRQG